MMNVASKGKSLVLLVGSLMASAGLQAKTVLWYHFDEAEPGTVTTESSVIVDAAGTQNGVPEYWWNNSKSSKPEFMPAYSNAFPVGRVWFDPVSGLRGSHNRCLHIVNPPIRGQYGNGEHGVVKIPDNKNLHLQTFTVECFVKDLYLSDPECAEVKKSGAHHYIVKKGNSWSLSILGGDGNGSDSVFKEVYRDVDGVATSWSDGVNANMHPRTQRDGNWHHVALVVDGTDQEAVKVEVYVDYVKQYNASKTMVGPVYYDSSEIWIGRNPGTSEYGWNGLIDELRISDRVLAPSEMLRFVNLKSDDDTLLYLSFDNWFGNLFKPNPCGSMPNTYLVNEAGLVESAVPVLARRSEETPLFPADSSGLLRRNIVTDVAYPNECSFQAVPNGFHQTLGISYPLTGSRAVTKDDFTIEVFVKYPALPGVYEYVMRNNSKFASSGEVNSWYMTCESSGKVNFAVNWKKTVTTPTPVLADGEWHHLAWVAEKENHVSRFYVDAAKIGEISDVDLCPISPADLADAGKLIFGSYESDGWNSNCFTGFLDELRVTGRALDPQEFLTTRPIDATLVAAARFEGDFTVGPYFAPVPDGVPSAGVSFATKVPAKTIVDGNGGTIAETNAKSVWLAGGTVDFGRNMPLENADEMTVEFFLRPEVVAEGGAEVMKLAATDGTVWAIRLSADRKTLSLVADTAAEAGQVLEFPVDLGPRWNHLAFTFAKRDGNTLVTAYRNGSSPVERTLTGTLKADGKSSFTLGSEGLSAYVDELRVSPTVLAPAAFMVCPDAPGMVLVFK